MAGVIICLPTLDNRHRRMFAISSWRTEEKARDGWMDGWRVEEKREAVAAVCVQQLKLLPLQCHSWRLNSKRLFLFHVVSELTRSLSASSKAWVSPLLRRLIFQLMRWGSRWNRRIGTRGVNGGRRKGKVVVDGRESSGTQPTSSANTQTGGLRGFRWLGNENGVWEPWQISIHINLHEIVSKCRG